MKDLQSNVDALLPQSSFFHFDYSLSLQSSGLSDDCMSHLRAVRETIPIPHFQDNVAFRMIERSPKNNTTTPVINRLIKSQAIKSEDFTKPQLEQCALNTKHFFLFCFVSILMEI